MQNPPELAEPAAETENPSEPAAPAAPTVPARPYQIPSIDFLQNGVSRAGDPAVDQEMKEKAGILVDTLSAVNPLTSTMCSLYFLTVSDGV